jgi:hypothetical protein
MSERELEMRFQKLEEGLKDDISAQLNDIKKSMEEQKSRVDALMNPDTKDNISAQLNDIKKSMEEQKSRVEALMNPDTEGLPGWLKQAEVLLQGSKTSENVSEDDSKEKKAALTLTPNPNQGSKTSKKKGSRR